MQYISFVNTFFSARVCLVSLADRLQISGKQLETFCVTKVGLWFQFYVCVYWLKHHPYNRGNKMADRTKLPSLKNAYGCISGNLGQVSWLKGKKIKTLIFPQAIEKISFGINLMVYNHSISQHILRVTRISFCSKSLWELIPHG